MRKSSGVADPAIPHLSRLACAPEAAAMLEDALAAGPLDMQAVGVLRRHQGSRWTLRCSVRSRTGTGAIIAKAYARDRGDVARVLSALRERELGSGQEMQVNAPIAYLPTLRILLLEEAPGETAREKLRRGEDGIGERTASWLASFHAAGIPLPAAYRLRDPLVRAQDWARALGANAPELGGEAGRLLAALAAAQPAWPPVAPLLVHGDFGASHIYLAPQTATVIDWDAWRVGDGAEDAGRFLASLHRIAARDARLSGVVEQEARAFTHAYRAADPAGGRELAFYEALACLKKAARLAKSRDQRRTRHAQALMAAASHSLTVPAGALD